MIIVVTDKMTWGRDRSESVALRNACLAGHDEDTEIIIYECHPDCYVDQAFGGITHPKGTEKPTTIYKGKVGRKLANALERLSRAEDAVDEILDEMTDDEE